MTQHEYERYRRQCTEPDAPRWYVAFIVVVLLVAACVLAWLGGR